jgi:RimJ/RimL family protein N-acetyltransferase
MIEFREANITDLLTYFEWFNDSIVRSSSFSLKEVSFKNHEKWFIKKLKDTNCMLLIFFEANNPVGQVRFEKGTFNNALISISISKEYRGKGFSKHILNKASKYFQSKNPNFIIEAYIKKNNISSIKSFEKASFKFQKELEYKGGNSFKYILKNENK